MTDHLEQPKDADVVLGGQAPAPVGGVVMGGLAGVKQRLTSGVIEHRIAALAEAIKYGDAGLELVIQALQDEAEQVRNAACLLFKRSEQLILLEKGVATWNRWRVKSLRIAGCNVDLAQVNLSGANLRKANFKESSLKRANLSGANLSKANFCNSDLIGANFQKSDLTWAKLSGANLTRANLSGANLSWANLSRANLDGANLSEANLHGANLSKANLSWVNLSEANLYEVNLSGANTYGVRGL